MPGRSLCVLRGLQKPLNRPPRPPRPLPGTGALARSPPPVTEAFLRQPDQGIPPWQWFSRVSSVGLAVPIRGMAENSRLKKPLAASL